MEVSGYRDRYVRFERALTPGATEESKITVEPEGRTLLGKQ